MKPVGPLLPPGPRPASRRLAEDAPAESASGFSAALGLALPREATRQVAAERVPVIEVPQDSGDLSTSALPAAEPSPASGDAGARVRETAGLSVAFSATGLAQEPPVLAAASGASRVTHAGAVAASAVVAEGVAVRDVAATVEPATPAEGTARIQPSAAAPAPPAATDRGQFADAAPAGGPATPVPPVHTTTVAPAPMAAAPPPTTAESAMVISVRRVVRNEFAAQRSPASAPASASSEIANQGAGISAPGVAGRPTADSSGVLEPGVDSPRVSREQPIAPRIVPPDAERSALERTTLSELPREAAMPRDAAPEPASAMPRDAGKDAASAVPATAALAAHPTSESGPSGEARAARGGSEQATTAFTPARDAGAPAAAVRAPGGGPADPIRGGAAATPREPRLRSASAGGEAGTAREVASDSAPARSRASGVRADRPVLMGDAEVENPGAPGAGSPGGAGASLGARIAAGPAPAKTAENAAREALAARPAAPTEPALTPRSASQVTVTFDGEGGASGRLRLNLRGDALRATIVTGTGPQAARMSEELGALERVLSERGFTEPRLSIHPSARTEHAEGASRQSHAGENRDRRSAEQDSPNRRSRQRTPRDRQER